MGVQGGSQERRAVPCWGCFVRTPSGASRRATHLQYLASLLLDGLHVAYASAAQLASGALHKRGCGEVGGAHW